MLEIVSPNQGAATEASEQVCNNNDTGGHFPQLVNLAFSGGGPIG